MSGKILLTAVMLSSTSNMKRKHAKRAEKA